MKLESVRSELVHFLFAVFSEKSKQGKLKNYILLETKNSLITIKFYKAKL